MSETELEKTEASKLIFAFTGLNLEEYADKLLRDFNSVGEDKTA